MGGGESPTGRVRTLRRAGREVDLPLQRVRPAFCLVAWGWCTQVVHCAWQRNTMR
jgi:hypothetical protein